MAIDWPTGFPIALRRDYGFEGEDVVLRTKMQGGNTLLRQIAPEGPEQIPVSWVMSDDVMALFKYWFANIAKSGSAEVAMPLRTNGLPVETQTVTFASRPAYSLIGHRYWRVSARLETRLPKLYTELEYQIAGYFGGESNFRLFANPIDKATNTDIPARQSR